MYFKAWKLAEEIKNPAAMVSAASGMAKLHGLNAPDKVQAEHHFFESDYLNEVQKNLR